MWDSSDNVEIHSANLLGSNEIEFPPILKKQKELYFLSIPSRLAKHINSDNFLRELRGLEATSGNIRLKGNTVLKHLLYLSTSGNVFF